MATSKVMNLGIQVTLDNKGAITGIKKMDKELDRASVTAKRSGKIFGKLGSTMGALGVAIGTAGLVRSISAATKAFADFNQQVTNVQNITGMANDEMNAFAEQLKGLPASLGGATDLTKGLYQALSSGVPKENVIGFIETNAMAARGNLADLTQTISASASIMNAFGLEGDDVNGVLDAMTKTVDLGVLTFGDLANNIGKASAMAANAGIGYEELFASVAQLTKGGLSVEESVTGIRAVMVAILKPTDDARKAMDELGIDMSAARLKAEGLQPIMADLGRIVGDDAEKMARLIPNIRGLGPALTLAKGEAEGFKDTFEQIADSNGKVETNFARMSDTLANRTEELKAQFERLKIEVGEELGPVLKETIENLIAALPGIAEKLAAVAKAVAGMVPTFFAILDVVEDLLPSMAALWAVSKVQAFIGFLTLLPAKFAAASAGAVGLQAALGPLTLAAAAAATAIAGINMYAEHLDDKYDALNEKSVDTTAAIAKLREGIQAQGMTMTEYANLMNVSATETEDLSTALLNATIAAAEAKGETSNYAFMLLGLDENGKAVKGTVEGLDEAMDTHTDTMRDATEIYEDFYDNLQDAFDLSRSLYDHFKKPTWTRFFENVNGGFSESMFAMQTMLDNGELSWKEFADAVALINQNLYEDQLNESMLGWKDDSEETVEDLVHHMETEVDNSDLEMPVIETEKAEKEMAQTMERMKLDFSDLIGKGFVGEMNSFADLWDGIWKDLAKSMSGLLTDAFSSAFGEIGKEGGDFFGSLFGENGSITSMFQNEDGSRNMGATVGGVAAGVGGVMQAHQNGDPLGGLMAGVMGGAAFGPIGMAVGGAIGLFAGLFGGDKGPRAGVAVGRREVAMHQGTGDVSDEELETMRRRVRSLYDNMFAGYTGILRQFGMADLFARDMFQGRMPVVDTGGGVQGMDIGALYDWLANTELPSVMENYFSGAINEGLSRYNVDDATIQAVWQQLDALAGEERIAFLSNFVASVVAINERLTAAGEGFDSFRDSIHVDSVTAFTDSIADMNNDIDVVMAAWDTATLEDVTNDVMAIGDAFDTALAGIEQMLLQIDATRQGIVSGWDAMQEDLLLSTMSESEQFDYLQNALDDAMIDLENATSVEDIAAANAAVEDYLRQIMGLEMFDPNSVINPTQGAETWAEWVNEIMQQASDTAEVGLDAVEDTVEAAYDSLVERIEAAGDALLSFEGIITSAGNPWSGSGYSPSTGYGGYDPTGETEPGDHKNPNDDSRFEGGGNKDLLIEQNAIMAGVAETLAEMNLRAAEAASMDEHLRIADREAQAASMMHAMREAASLEGTRIVAETPMVVNVHANIDGEPVYSQVESQLENLAEWVVRAVQPTPVIE